LGAPAGLTVDHALTFKQGMPQTAVEIRSRKRWRVCLAGWTFTRQVKRFTDGREEERNGRQFRSGAGLGDYRVSQDTPGAREQWGSRTAFVLAAIGAAVGLGNVWRFSYVAGENGGATFLLIYLLAILLIGWPLVLAEATVGRHSQGDAVTSYRAVARERIWIGAGALGVFGMFLIMCFYFVIAGWALKYFAGALTGSLWRMAEDSYGSYFDAFVASPWEPLFWQFLMVSICVLVVAQGVRGGIERLTRVLIPILALIVVGLAIYGVTHRGAAQGLAFMFAPDWSLLLTPDIYLAALGQAFFSLSLGMGLYVTYSSYLSKSAPLPGSVGAVIAGDTLMAVIAGIAIFPAVFAFGLDPASGPSLVFITLPQVFLEMPAGRVVGLLFFFLLAAAAMSASISGVQIVSAWAANGTGWSRRRTVLTVGSVMFVCGAPASLGYGLWADIRWEQRGILESMDYIVSNFVLPAGGVLTALFVGWRWSEPALAEAGLAGRMVGAVWIWLLRIVAPAVIVVIALRAIGAI